VPDAINAQFLPRSRRTLAIFLALMLLPLLFNLIVMWKEAGLQASYQAIAGTYECSTGLPCAPFPKVILALSAPSLLLSLFAVFTIHLARGVWLVKLPRVLSLSTSCVLGISTAIIFRYVAGLLMPLAWLPVFGDYLLGMPVSPTAETASWYGLFPLVIVVFTVAVAGARKTNHHEVPPSPIKEAA
jgi:hypothetical protein